MRSPAGAFVALLFLLQACALARPTASVTPAPVPSAASPALEGQGDLRYAHRGLEAVRKHLQRGGGVAEPENVAEGTVTCVRATGGEELLCTYGPDSVRPVALGILWLDNGSWQAQLYPQARGSAAVERQALFSPSGCSFGCFGQVRLARAVHGEARRELLVVVDLAAKPGTSPHEGGEVSKAEPSMEEVHLLRLVDGVWQVVWLPGPGDWNWGHAKVDLPVSGVAHFRVRSSSWWREDRLARYLAEPAEGEHRWFAERWVRRGDGYSLRERTEEPSAYGTLVRLVHYLSIGEEQRALALIDPAVGLEAARTALAQRPPQQNWAVKRTGELTYQIARNREKGYDLVVRLVRTEEGFRLAGLGRP